MSCNNGHIDRVLRETPRTVSYKCNTCGRIEHMNKLITDIRSKTWLRDQTLKLK
jgi:hypothetical protein